MAQTNGLGMANEATATATTSSGRVVRIAHGSWAMPVVGDAAASCKQESENAQKQTTSSRPVSRRFSLPLAKGERRRRRLAQLACKEHSSLARGRHLRLITLVGSKWGSGWRCGSLATRYYAALQLVGLDWRSPHPPIHPLFWSAQIGMSCTLARCPRWTHLR